MSLAMTVRGKKLEFQHRVFLGHGLASLFKVYSDIFQLLRSKEWTGEERGSRNRAGVLWGICRHHLAQSEKEGVLCALSRRRVLTWSTVMGHTVAVMPSGGNV